jgi:HPt (histidine-containing phosphotransfer) domain-containing protein
MKKLYNTETILKTHYGDTEFVKSMAELFIEHLPEMSAELQKASAKKDWASLYFYAHKMKASIDLFSIESLTDVIRKLEKQGKAATDSQTLRQDVNYVADIINACVAQLKNDFALAN